MIRENCLRWSAHTGRLHRVLQIPLVCLVLSGATLAQAEEPFVQSLPPHADLVRWVGFSGDGRLLASASWDGTIRLTQLPECETLQTFVSRPSKNFWGGFSSIEGRSFVSGTGDSNVFVWNGTNGASRHKIASPHTQAWAGAVGFDGRDAYTGGPEGNIVRWDISSGSQRAATKNGAPVWSIAASPKGPEFAVGGGDGRIRVFGEALDGPLQTFGDHPGGVYCVAYSPNGSLIASAGADGSARIWDARSGVLKHSLPHFGPVFAVAFSADGAWCAAGGNDGNLKIWNVSSGAYFRKLAGHAEPIWTAAFSPSSDQIATAGADKQLRLWNWKRQPYGLAAKKRLPRKVDLSPQFRNWNLKIVQQRSRGSCSVHTFTRALEFAASKNAQRGMRLSDEYLNWACNQVVGNVGPTAKDRGQFFEHLWLAFLRHGICPAAQMPFRDQFDPNYVPSPMVIASAQRQSQTVYWHDLGGPGIDDQEVVRRVKCVLAAGWPVLAGSTHSVLVVGYVDDERMPGGGRFLIADSGGGGFIGQVTADRLHSAITYDRMKDYQFSWIECIGGGTEAAKQRPPTAKKGK